MNTKNIYLIKIDQKRRKEIEEKEIQSSGQWSAFEFYLPLETFISLLINFLSTHHVFFLFFFIAHFLSYLMLRAKCSLLTTSFCYSVIFQFFIYFFVLSITLFCLVCTFSRAYLSIYNVSPRLKELMHSMGMSMVRERSVKSFLGRIQTRKPSDMSQSFTSSLSIPKSAIGWLELRKVMKSIENHYKD